MPQVSSIKTYTDRDGDVIMSDTSPPTNAQKDKSIFDWFSFEGKTAPLKSPTYSPVSPTEKSILSASTASPSSYFTNSPFSAEAPAQRPPSLEDLAPPKVKYPAPPAKALRWIWQCHLCSSRYPLAVTRRCLVDGHYYCSGNSQTQRNVKKRRRNQSCTSEFDYVAWKEWGQWKRKTLALQAYADQKEEPKLLGCEGCSSPSQCRYESRKRVETIKFEDFIEDDDLIADQKKGPIVACSKSEEKAHQPKRVKIPAVEEEKNAKSRISKTKKGLKLDSTSLSSGRRFYSSFSSSMSHRDLSPTSESLSMERGKFDPTLPSVTRSVSKEKEELAAIESTLKASLAKQKQQSSSLTTTPEISSQAPPKTKRRLNTKKDDLQFEVAAKDKPPTSLQRTASQPSLLTDFFRQSKVPTIIEPPPVQNDARAASEADITAFLQSTPTWDIDDSEVIPQTMRQSSATVPANNISHFEDIDLSGSLPSSADVTQGHSRELVLGTGHRDNGSSTKELADAGTVQVQVPISGNAASRVGFSFGLGFGRK